MVLFSGSCTSRRGQSNVSLSQIVLLSAAWLSLQNFQHLLPARSRGKNSLSETNRNGPILRNFHIYSRQSKTDGRRYDVRVCSYFKMKPWRRIWRFPRRTHKRTHNNTSYFPSPYHVSPSSQSSLAAYGRENILRPSSCNEVLSCFNRQLAMLCMVMVYGFVYGYGYSTMIGIQENFDKRDNL
jgi:uncharacterized protein (DUF3084 family)